MMKKGNRISAVIFVMIMIISVSGCGVREKKGAEQNSTREKEATTATRAPEKVLNVNSENKLIYCITPDISNPHFAIVQKACTEEGEKLGYKVECVSHGDDAVKQEELFEEAISRRASAIICDNAGADASVTAIQKARDAGIPTFLVDREISMEGLCISQITADNVQGATDVAKALAEATGGEGDYAELQGLGSDTNGKIRSEAFHKILDQTDMKMVARQAANWSRKEARKKTTTILQQYPDIVAIVCGNDTMACGAAEALAEFNLDHDVYIIGIDGSEEMQKNIIDGKCLATAFLPIEKMTKNAVDQADDYLREGSTGLEERQVMECTVITKDNVDKLNF